MFSALLMIWIQLMFQIYVTIIMLLLFWLTTVVMITQILLDEKRTKISSTYLQYFFLSVSWECLKNPVIAEACNNQNSFLISMNSVVRCMISQGAKRCRIANVRVKVFNKHQNNVNYVTKTRNNLLAIIWFWY